MNLVDVYQSTPVFVVHCSRCGLRTQSDRGLVADLDAAPWTFYCPSCSAALRGAEALVEGVAP